MPGIERRRPEGGTPRLKKQTRNKPETNRTEKSDLRSMPGVIHDPLPARFGRESYTVDDEKGFKGGERFLRDFW